MNNVNPPHTRPTAMLVKDKMALTPEEKERALALKGAIEANPKLRSLPDMDVAQVAIVRSRPQHLDYALDTIYKMQCFREINKIQDTVQDGMATIQAFMTLQPGFLLDITYLPAQGTYTWSFDYAKLNPSALKTPQDWRTFQAGFYYMLRASVTDFEVIRTGLMSVCECEGTGWQNFDLRSCEKAVYGLWAFYPAIYKETVWLNTPVPANICYSLLKKIVTQELANSWRIGGQIDGFEGRLNALFHMPNQEVAEQSLLERIEGYLSERYEKERTFSFDNCSTTDSTDDDMIL